MGEAGGTLQGCTAEEGPHSRCQEQPPLGADQQWYVQRPQTIVNCSTNNTPMDNELLLLKEGFLGFHSKIGPPTAYGIIMLMNYYSLYKCRTIVLLWFGLHDFTATNSMR